MTDNGGRSQGLVSRRDALRKSAVAAGVVGVAWSAPKVEGLSLRPNYAAAQSGPVCINIAQNANRNTSGGSSDASYFSGAALDHPNVGARFVNLSARSTAGGGVNVLRIAVTGSGLSNCSLNFDAVDPAVGFNVHQVFADRSVISSSVRGTFGAATAIGVAGQLCCD